MGLSSVSVVTNSLRLLRFHDSQRPSRPRSAPVPSPAGPVPPAQDYQLNGNPARVRIHLAGGGWIEGHAKTAG